MTSKMNSRRDWEVVIFKNNEANAFALPGGKIAINTGLLRVAVNQDQLAAVVGHEIGHIIAHHGHERMSQQLALDSVSLVSAIVTRGISPELKGATDGLLNAAQLGILYPFSRIQEEEADAVGLKLAAQAGFHPNEAIEFWRNMEVYSSSKPDLKLSSHPPNEVRIASLTALMPEASKLFDTNQAPPHCEP